MAKFIQNLIDEIIDQYVYADETNRPWIIGFSGGKDSTVMLQLVWKAISQIKELTGIVKRDIYVVCNDTMVENPVITEYVYRVLDKIEQAAVEQDIPIRVIKTIPRRIKNINPIRIRIKKANLATMLFEYKNSRPPSTYLFEENG